MLQEDIEAKYTSELNKRFSDFWSGQQGNNIGKPVNKWPPYAIEIAEKVLKDSPKFRDLFIKLRKKDSKGGGKMTKKRQRKRKSTRKRRRC